MNLRQCSHRKFTGIPNYDFYHVDGVEIHDRYIPNLHFYEFFICVNVSGINEYYEIIQIEILVKVCLFG